MFKVNELFPFNELLLRVDRQLCNETINRGLANLCAKALFALGGDDSEQLNRVRVHLTLLGILTYNIRIYICFFSILEGDATSFRNFSRWRSIFTAKPLYSGCYFR